MRMAPIEHASAIPAGSLGLATSPWRLRRIESAEGSERYDAEQQPTEGVRFEEVAGRAAIEYDEPERAELDHIAPRASLCRAAWGSRPHPICSTRCQNGLAACTNAAGLSRPLLDRSATPPGASLGQSCRGHVTERCDIVVTERRSERCRSGPLHVPRRQPSGRHGPGFEPARLPLSLVGRRVRDFY